MLGFVGSLDKLVLPRMNGLLNLLEAAARAAVRYPVPCTDAFPAIREAVIASLQERWQMQDATLRMGELTWSVSHPWS